MSDAFAQECAAAAKGLRRVPAELRRALATEVKAAVADPLAGRVKAAAAGPWARVLAAGTKSRAGADPTILVGGSSPRASGGAGPRALVYGTEFGGGKRLTAVPGRKGRRGYRRYSTNQFRANHRPFVFPTIEANMPKVLDAFAGIVSGVLDDA